MMDHYKS